MQLPNRLLNMSCKVGELDDPTLPLLCVDGLGASTLSAIAKGAGGLELTGSAVLQGDAQQWLPKGACVVIREAMMRTEIVPARWSAEVIDASITTVINDDFPLLLPPLPACPAMLWYLGNINVMRNVSVAVVGSRRCTKYGLCQPSHFSTAIVESEVAIISGGARGIDASAHRAALGSNGETAAILRSGLSIVYPPEHAALFEAIVTGGGVMISEFPCHRSPRP